MLQEMIYFMLVDGMENELVELFLRVSFIRIGLFNKLLESVVGMMEKLSTAQEYLLLLCCPTFEFSTEEIFKS